MPRFPHPSPTSEGLSDKVFGALVAKARAQGGKVHALHVGDTWLDPYEGARAEAQLTAEHPRLHNYSPVQGEPALLDAISRFLRTRADIEVPREDVQVMPGGTAGLSVVIAALVMPGDEVLLPAPFWPLIRGIITSRGGRAVEVPLFDRLDDPSFDIAAHLERHVTGRTTAVYVNSPNNPTGRVLTERALEAITRVATRHHLWVVSDEAYELLDFRREPASIPIWARAELAERTVATHTLSKSHGLAGSRVGFTHGPPAIMAAIRGVQTFMTYCAPRPMQLGAARALDEGGAWLSRARTLYATAGKRAAETLGVEPPEAGTFLFFDASRWLAPGEELVAFLERCVEAGVLLTPGAACGRDYARWARLCFTTVPPPELDDALARLASVLER